MRARVARFAAVGAVVAATGVGGVLAGGGTADAAQPLVVGSCNTTVSGAPGQPVTLEPSAITSIVPSSVLSGLGINVPAISLGQVPASGSKTISGSTIANDVAGLANTGGSLLGGLTNPLSALTSTLTSACGVTVKAINTVAAPVQQGASQVGGAVNQTLGGVTGGGHQSPPTNGGGHQSPPTNGGGGHQSPPTNGGGSSQGNSNPLPNPLPENGNPTGNGVPLAGALSYQSLGGFGSALAPSAVYGNIPYATPGFWAPSPGVRYGGQVPGYSPQFGALGQGTNGTGDSAVQTAGRAEALGDGSPAGNTVGLPLLLAVLALSGVTAAMVRTWVVRKMTA
ncbi:MAG: hypothetical protein J2O49_07750 [Sciscionella sp.]|nr:hypothetical protein [Sciscionella sp.]